MKTGQKVIYVDDNRRNGKRFYSDETLPELGSTYTIRAIIPRESRGYEDEDTILLDEIINRERDYRGPLGPVRCELSFRMSRFRPASNIDVFLRMLRGKVAPEAQSVVHLGNIEDMGEFRECLTPDAMAEVMDRIAEEKRQERIAASTAKPSLAKAMAGWKVARRVLGKRLH